MDHKHYTNIKHDHTVNDPGHGHNLFGGPRVYNANRYLSNSADGSNVIGANTPDWAWSIAVGGNTTGITVNGLGDDWRLSTESRYIGNEGVNRQYTESNDANAIENRPKNYTVKIWKRTA